MAATTTPQPGQDLLRLQMSLLPMLAGILQHPALRQVQQLEAINRVLQSFGMPAIRTTSGAFPDRYLLEFLTKQGGLGRVVASGPDPRQFLLYLENARNQVNPAGLLPRVQQVAHEVPEGVRGGLLGFGSARQVIDALRSLPGVAAFRLLLPLFINPSQTLPAPLQVRG